MIARLLLWLELLWLRWELDSDERWVKACQDDGILDSVSLLYIRECSEAKRVRIAVILNELLPSPASAARAKGARKPQPTEADTAGAHAGSGPNRQAEA